MCHMSCVIVLTFQCIRSQRNRSDWCGGTVIVFLVFAKYCESSSTVTCVSNMFVVCGIDMGLV